MTLPDWLRATLNVLLVVAAFLAYHGLRDYARRRFPMGPGRVRPYRPRMKKPRRG
jgi:hypothetical protein